MVEERVAPPAAPRGPCWNRSRLVLLLILGLVVAMCVVNALLAVFTSIQTHIFTVTCGALWWPQGVTHSGLSVHVTRTMLADSCIFLVDYKSAGERLDDQISQFAQTVQQARKKHVKLADYLTSLSRKKSIKIGQFQPIDFTTGYVVSAFLDRRTHPSATTVRVLYVAPKSTSTLYCQAVCEDSGRLVSVPGHPEFLYFYGPVHQNCLWHQFVLRCHFPLGCHVTNVSVTSHRCLEPTNQLAAFPLRSVFKERAFLGLCLNHIFYYKAKDVPRIVRFFETFLHFGGDFIYLYGTFEVDDAVRNVLRHYVNKGVLTQYDWSIPTDLSSLFYFAQVLQNMDCTYRHMGEVQHLVYLDLDESLYPLHPHNTYRELISYLNTNTYAGQHYAGLSLERINTYISDLDRGEFSQEPVKRWCPIRNPKPLVRPRYVITVGVHTLEEAFIPFKADKPVDRDIAVVFHFKDEPLVCSVTNHVLHSHVLLMNQSLWKWYPVIKKKAKEVLMKL